MSIDYKVIKEALNTETHDKIRNQVGEELQKTLRTYEAEIRAKKGIDNVQKFTSDLRGAIAKVLARHLKIEKAEGAIDALTQGILDGVFQEYFGFNATEAQRRLKDERIDNYDDFSHQYIDTTRTQAIRQVQSYGVTGVQQHMQDADLRGKFFDTSENDLGAGYKWTPHARKTSMDHQHVATMLSAGISGQMSPDYAKRSKKHVAYSPK